jgi:hypothetical protein
MLSATPAPGPAASASAAVVPPGDIPGQVRAAFSVLVADPGPWTPHGFASIARLRERLPGIPRAELDAALIRMYKNQEINLVRQSNQLRLTEAERAAAVRCGGQDKHNLSFPGPPLRPGFRDVHRGGRGAPRGITEQGVAPELADADRPGAAPSSP